MHVNVLDHRSGCVALVNASAHGGGAATSFAGAALLHVPGRGWTGALDAAEEESGSAAGSMIAAGGVAVAYDRGRLLVSAAMPGIAFDFEGEAETRSFDVPRRFPFGSGWLSWSVVPRLSLRGGIAVAQGAGGRAQETRLSCPLPTAPCPLHLDLGEATGYHDRNWGRWTWGDDARWDWAVCAAADGRVIVFTQDTTRDGRVVAGPIVLVDSARGRRVFQDASVSVDFSGELAPPRLRLPGALAALHQDRRRPPLPSRLHVHCEDGFDALDLELHGRDACQLIAAEAGGRDYGFIHEIASTFALTGRLHGERVDAHGLAVWEYVW